MREATAFITTGAACGIGLRIAKHFAALGATVLGWNLVRGDNPCFRTFFQCDATDEASVAEATSASFAAVGHVGILVNNAGINGPIKPT